jgi:hypothetical protein
MKLQNLKRKVFLSDVLYLFHLTTSGSKRFCGLTLFGRKKNFQPLLVCRCVSLLLGGGESVFLDAWCVRTSLRIGWQTRKMLERGSWQGVKCVVVHCVLRMGWSSPPMFTLFCGFCLKMGLVVFMSLTPHTVLPQISVCVRVIGMREGGECWN